MKCKSAPRKCTGKPTRKDSACCCSSRKARQSGQAFWLTRPPLPISPRAAASHFVKGNPRGKHDDFVNCIAYARHCVEAALPLLHVYKHGTNNPVQATNMKNLTSALQLTIELFLFPLSNLLSARHREVVHWFAVIRCTYIVIYSPHTKNGGV